MKRLLLTGKSGQVGFELQSALSALGEVHAVGRHKLDLNCADCIRTCVREIRPAVIVNAAGYTKVDEAESNPDQAMRVNGIAPGILAEEASRIGAVLIHYSTDYVYDGLLGRPYVEDDEVNPVNLYGVTKLAGEKAIEAVGAAYVILRTSWAYSNRGVNFVQTLMRLARERKELRVVDDQYGSPSWARMLANATASLLRKQELITRHSGIYHLSATGTTSRYDFAKAILHHMKKMSPASANLATVTAIKTDQYPTPAKRPLHLTTNKDKIKSVLGIEMPRWEDQLEMFMNEHFAGIGRC